MEKKEYANGQKATGYAITISRLFEKASGVFTKVIGYRQHLREKGRDVEAI